MPQSSPTLVTAIFDLGRESLPPPFGRDTDHYRRHLPAVLSIDCPMVVYTDAAHLELVRELRGERPTRIQTLSPAALANVRASGARWPLATTGAAGGLPAPVARLADGDGTGLGVWLLHQER